MRTLYVLFSRPNTRIGRAIRLILRNSRYTHVSLALDGDLGNIYSFSRARFDSPFSGGLMHEYVDHYLIKGDIRVKLCRVELGEEEYAKAEQKLEHCFTHRKRLIYNLYDAAALPFKRRVKLRDAFTCVGFTSYIIGHDDIGDIGALEDMLSEKVIYEGSLAELAERIDAKRSESPEFYERLGKLRAAEDFVSLNRRLYRRWKNRMARMA